MALYLAFVKAVGRAAVNAVGGGLAADVICDVLPELAQKVYDWWAADRAPEQRRAEIEALAEAPPEEFKQLVAQAVAELAPGQPVLQERLSIYLSLLPGVASASLRLAPEAVAAPDDPAGLLSLLPAHLPRFKPGARPLAGIDWELEALLGAGGFGEVWKARNPHFDGVPPVALKFCLDPSARDRLLRHEAAVLNQVMRQGSHPGIVALRHTYLSADPPCLEYDFVSGGDLAGLIPRWRPGAARVLTLIAELADIVAFAHRLSPPIVHRDLKPANILLAPAAGGEFRLRIADFGIGGLATSHARAVSARGVSRGDFLLSALRGAHTPLYASPQQMRGAAPDPRDDVYSLGVIWYQLLTGDLLTGRPGGTRWPARLTAAGVPATHVELLAACLEDDPADRPADAGALSERCAALPAPPTPVRAAPTQELPRHFVNSAGMRFVLIPAGTFLLGSPPDEPMRGADEGLARRVRIEQPYYVGVFPVTQKQYAAFMAGNPAHFQRKNGGGPEHPVEQVSWHDAINFCRKLTARPEEKRAGRVYRLPTEAEWECACRAGTTTPFAFGDTLSSTQANFDGTHPYGAADIGPFRKTTTKVGTYEPNAWGLYDMHGNVWEWCADWYSPGTQRTLRGGSWNNSGHLCRSARRQKYAPDFRGDNVGFRIAVALA